MSAGIQMRAGGKPHVDGCGPTQKLWPKGQILLQNGDYFGAFEMQMADGTRPRIPVELSGAGLLVRLETRDRLACRGLAPVLLGWLVV